MGLLSQPSAQHGDTELQDWPHTDRFYIMSANRGAFDATNAVRLKNRGEVWRKFRPMLPYVLVLYFPLLVLISWMLLSFVPGDRSAWWAWPTGALLCLLSYLAVWLLGKHNLRRTQLGITDEGFILRVPEKDAYLRYSDMITFARTREPDTVAISSRNLDTSHQRSLDQVGGQTVAAVLVFNCQLVPTNRSAMMRKAQVNMYLARFEDTTAPVQQAHLDPADFEESWRAGQIGQAIRRHRPDLIIPLGDTPLPLLYPIQSTD